MLAAEPVRPRPVAGASVDPAAGIDEPFLIRNPTVLADGALLIRLGGETIPLLHCDAPVQTFHPGWHAECLFTGFAPIFLLELVNVVNDARATWILDHRMQMMGDRPEHLLPDLANLLKSKALPLLQSIVSQAIDRVAPALDPRMRAFLQVNRETRIALGHLCIEQLLARPSVYRIGDLAPRSLVFIGENCGLRVIDRAQLAAGLDTTWQDVIATAVSTGRLEWPSPVDGHMVGAQGSFVFDDFHFAYRFADIRNGLVFHVLVADHLSRIAGIWFPALGILAAHDGLQLGLGQLLAPMIRNWCVLHALVWADSLIPYFARNASRLASVMRGPPGLHLGHQLWNELSGIERMVRNDPARLPDWIVMDAASGSELYGPVDELFPELLGKVERRVGSGEQLTAYAYSQGCVIVRVTDEFVSAGLRHRIVRRVAGLAVSRQVAATMEGAPGSLVILVGLRVENRTAGDLAGFLCRFAHFVGQNYPGTILVFDGHNTLVEGSTAVLGSHGEDSASRPIDVERALVAAVRASCTGHPVTVVDTIGQSMAASLAWAAACDGFVSFWGASLAKYRWVCNKPGYVVTNRTNLLAREALHIYSAPRYMADPTPLLFIDPGLVTDDAEAVQLLRTSNDPGGFNFHVDLDGMLAEIDGFIGGLVREKA